MDTITLKKKDVIEIYTKSNKEDKKLLEAIFGEDLFNTPIQERVKHLRMLVMNWGGRT